MKRKSVLRRLLWAAALILLIPCFTCVLFRITAKKASLHSAAEALKAMQETVLSALDDFRADEPYGASLNDRFAQIVVKSFSEADLNANFMVLDPDYRFVFPPPQSISPELDSLRKTVAGQAESMTQGKSTVLESESGSRFLVSLRSSPADAGETDYIVSFCRYEEISSWVKNATLLALVISTGITLAVYAVLCLAIRSASLPLRELCEAVERIDQGRLEPIEGSFSLQEPEKLRLTINRMIEKLRKLEQRRQMFFQNTSHALKTPLMIIAGYAQGIEEGVFSPPERAAHNILHESGKMHSLVNDMITLSRLDTPLSEDRLALLSLNLAAKDLVERYRNNGEKKQLILSLGDQESTVLADEELMDQILENLMSNALRYAREKIWISVYPENGELRLSIADDGEGIRQEDLPHVFELFYKGSGGQNGLGLAVARQAAQQMNGTLTAENRPEGGARFTLRLPAATLAEA